MPNSIEKYRRAQKMSMEALGAEIGTDASTVNKLEKEKIGLSQERAIKIAAVLGVTTDELFADPSGTPEIPPANKAAAGKKEMIGVLGTAAGSLISGASQLTNGPIEYMDLPKALENSRGIYALYIDGISMEPMFKHGSKVIVSEYRPARLGDAVVVQERHESTAPYLVSIGVLHSRSAEKLVLQKLNPPGLVELNPNYIVAVHKVIDYSELLG